MGFGALFDPHEYGNKRKQLKPSEVQTKANAALGTITKPHREGLKMMVSHHPAVKGAQMFADTAGKRLYEDRQRTKAFAKKTSGNFASNEDEMPAGKGMKVAGPVSVTGVIPKPKRSFFNAAEAVAAEDPEAGAESSVPNTPPRGVPRDPSIRMTNQGVSGDVQGAKLLEEIDRDMATQHNARARAVGVEPKIKNPDGSLQVGNMDVDFAPGTSEEAMRNFLRDPVKPAAGIARYAANQNAKIARGGTRRPRYNNAFGVEGPDSFGEMVQDVYNTKKDGLMRGIERKDIELANDMYQTDINAANVVGMNELRNQGVREGELDIRQNTQLAELQDLYLSEDTSPEMREKIEEQLRVLQGGRKSPEKPHIFYRERLEGENTLKNPYIYENGEVRPLFERYEEGQGLPVLKQKGDRPDRIGWVIVKGRPYYWDGTEYHEDLSTVKG